MSWFRVRLFLRRFPVGYWVAAFLLVFVTGATVSSLVGRASAAAARWGSLQPVAVASGPLAAGQVLRAGDVTLQPVPTALLPAGALRRVPVGRALVAPLSKGEILVSVRLAAAGQGGIAALLPTGARALAVPVGPGTPPLRRGDRVDVLATFGQEPTFAVAAGAGVVAVTAGKAVTVALTAEEAPRVAFALAGGTVTLALVR